LAPEPGPVNGSGTAGILPRLPDYDVNGQVQAVPAPRSNLGFTVKLFLVVLLAIDDPFFDGLFLESPDVP